MDEYLTNHLAVLEADVIRTVRLAPVEAVRAHGDRRRRWWATRAFAAVVALLAAIGLGAGGVAVTVGSRPDPLVAFPAGLVMPHEGEPGWHRDDSPTVKVAFNPCEEPDVSLTDRVDARTMTGVAFPDDPHPVHLVQQLFLYRDGAAATAAMTKLQVWATREAEAGCGWTGGVYQGSLDLGQEVLWSGAQLDDGWHDALVARHGNTIFVLTATGEQGVTPYNEDLAAAVTVQERLCAHMGICRAANGTPGPDSFGATPAPSWWDFLQTPYPNATVPYDPWEHLNPVITPTP
jgi:hypothetical protein